MDENKAETKHSTSLGLVIKKNELKNYSNLLIKVVSKICEQNLKH